MFPVCYFSRLFSFNHKSPFQTPVLDFNNQLLAPGGKGTWGSWGKGSSGGSTTKPADSGRFLRQFLHIFCIFVSNTYLVEHLRAETEHV